MKSEPDTSSLMQQVEHTIQILEKLQGFPAQRTRNMIDQHGCKEALSLLMKNSKIHSGLKTLAKNGYLGITFESIVEKNPKEFNVEIVDAAIWRLNEYRSKQQKKS